MSSIKSKSKDIKNKTKKNATPNISNINAIRNKIDNIDISIHDLIMKRTLCVKDIAKEKSIISVNKAIIYRPAREHEILMALIKRHKGDFPLEVLIKIWRSLIGAYISIQGNLKIGYFHSFENLVKDYFGITMTYNGIKNIKKSFNNLSSNIINLLVLPIPNNRIDWWLLLFNYKNIFIIGKLSVSFLGKEKALILGSQDVEYTSINKVIYMVAIKIADVNFLKKYFLKNNYLILAKSKINIREYAFLFSKTVTSQEEALNNLSLLKNKSFVEDKNIRIAGVLPNIEK